jgi:hypothetical protein
MAATLTLDLGLDFTRALPGEARVSRDDDRIRRSHDETFPTPADASQRDDAAGLRPRRGPTLDELIVGVWEGLQTDHTAACPVCGGAMRARHGAGPRPVGGRCDDCGTVIS